MAFNHHITKTELLRLLDSKWFQLIENLDKKPYWDRIVEGINKSIDNGNVIIPSEENIFKALNEINFSKFRVLMIGQDPYPTIGYATGFAFSANNISGKPLPGSLMNIFKEIDRSYGSSMTESPNGNLFSWKEQGVLLLNSYLTIGTTISQGRSRKINDSHREIGWGEFISDVIRYLDKSYKFVTLALGREAQKISLMLDKNKKFIVEAPHPSPINTIKQFLGCDCFVKCNELLIQNELLPIKWTF